MVRPIGANGARHSQKQQRVSSPPSPPPLVSNALVMRQTWLGCSCAPGAKALATHWHCQARPPGHSSPPPSPGGLQERQKPSCWTPWPGSCLPAPECARHVRRVDCWAGNQSVGSTTALYSALCLLPSRGCWLALALHCSPRSLRFARYRCALVFWPQAPWCSGIVAPACQQLSADKCEHLQREFREWRSLPNSCCARPSAGLAPLPRQLRLLSRILERRRLRRAMQMAASGMSTGKSFSPPWLRARRPS